MVNLPDAGSQKERSVGEWGSNRPWIQSHRNWGSRFGPHRDLMRLRAEPTTLNQMEDQANRTVFLMAKHGNNNHENNFRIAMDLLREQYNLNFMMLCELCGGVHSRHHDELTAPER